MKRLKKFLLLGLSLLLVSAPACKFRPPDSGTTYRVAFESDVPSLDPINVGDTTSHEVAYNIYNGLVTYRVEIKKPGEKLTDLEPDLAESWDISEDGKVYTFKLRKGVKFHNGRELVADDVKYSIERLANPANASKGLWTLGALPLKGLEAFQEAGKEGKTNIEIEGIKVLDKYTVQFVLETMTPLALNVLAMSYYFIVPKEEAEKWGKDFTTHPVGTGPFKFKEWKRGKRLTLVKNEDYFEQGLPYLDKIEYEIIPSDLIRLGRFENGQLEHVDNASIPSARFESIINDERWNPMGADALRKIEILEDQSKSLIMKKPIFSTEYLGMNVREGIFRDKRIRKAFNYAVDKQKIVDRIYTGRRTVAKGVLPPGFPGFKENRAVPYPYDPDKALALLAESGWQDTDNDGILDKDGKKLSITLWHNQRDVLVALSGSVQADLMELGIEIDVQALQWAPYLEKIRNDEAIFFRFGWMADYPDPDNFIWTLFSSDNIGQDNSTNFSNAEVDKLLTAARATTDWATREKLYQQAEDIIIDEAPWIFLENEVQYKIAQPYVKGQMIHPIEQNIMKIIKLEK